MSSFGMLEEFLPQKETITNYRECVEIFSCKCSHGREESPCISQCHWREHLRSTLQFISTCKATGKVFQCAGGKAKETF